MPDTGLITDSFPWLVKRYIPVFNGENSIPVNPVYTNESGVVLTDENNAVLITELATIGFGPDLADEGSGDILVDEMGNVLVEEVGIRSPGDLYRYI